LDKRALCILSNKKIINEILNRNWDEGLIYVEQARILNHSYDETTCLLEAIIYKLGYQRDDKVSEALKYISEEDPNYLIVKTYLHSLVGIISKLQNSEQEMYKMDRKEVNRILEIMQETLNT